MASPAPPAARGSFADVTALVRSAAKELGTGELLLASHYSMFQAMSAVQILNPRFDTGCAVLSEQERGCMSVASIRGKRDWTVPEIVALCDRLLGLEASGRMEWLSGQPVSQTVFTCVYLHDLPSVSSRIVHSFLQLLLCQMARARSFVHEQGIFFEEDFNMDLYGFELEPRGVKPSELQSSMLELIGKLKDAATKGASAADIDALSVDSDLSVARQHLTQLVARLEFILSLSQLLDAIQDFNPELIAGALPPLRESLALMIATQSSVKVDAAFDGLINRLKYSQYPAIQAAPLTTLDGLKAWMALLGHIGEILAWRTNEDELTIMETASNFAAANPVMCSLSRAFMHYALFADGKLLGKRPAVVAVRSAMMQTLLPPFDEASSARMADIMDLLCTRCEEAFSYNFKLFCFNRARQRRNLFKAIEAWDAVQQECEALDVEITAIHEGHDDAEASQQYYFSSWVYTQKLRAMTECYALGFELELYYVNEYPMIFWYLQYLHDTRAGYLERMLKLRAAGAESKRDLLSSFARDNETIEQFLTMEAYRDHAKTKMCLGLLEVTRVLRSLGLLDVVEPDMNTEELNYVNRFRVMTHLSSPLVLQTESYMEFMHKAGRKGIDPHIKVATMEFQTAKAYLEQIATTKRTDAHSLALKAEGQALLKVCIGNLIGLRMFPWKCMAELPADAKTPMANQRRVLFDFKYHSAFPFLVREP